MPRINSRSKGSRNERDICKVFEKWTGYEFNRTPASGGLRWKKTDNITGDLICSEPNVIFPFSIECKSYKDLNFSHLLYLKNTEIEGFWKQALDDSERGHKIPMLLMRYNGLPKDFHFIVLAMRDYVIFKDDLHQAFPIMKLPLQKLVILNSGSIFRADYSVMEAKALKLIKLRWPRKK